jgi:hypothetical protein
MRGGKLMVFFSVRVGTFLIKYSPFSDNDEQFPIVDKDKNLLDYVKGTRTNGYYINPATKEKVDKTYILVNDEVKDKLPRTKETDKFKIVDKNEIADLVNPKMYIVECDKLKDELSITNKALKFGISFGGKSKPYYAIVCLNPIYNILEMWISKGKKSEQYLSYTENLKDRQRLQEITLSIDGIDKAKVEDLITL